MKKAPLNEIARLLIDRGYFALLTFRHTDSVKGDWMYYNGICWQADCEKRHEIALKRFFDDHKMLKPTDKDYVSDLGKFGSCHLWNNLLRILRTEPEISRVQEDYDGKMNLLNMENGTYNLDTEEFQEHRAQDMLTKVMGAKYDENSECPTLNRFINEVLCGDGDVIDYVQKYLGYSMSPSTEEQCLLFLFGTGANGKSVFTELFLRIAGDYGKKISTQGIIKSRSSSEMDRKEQIKSDMANVRLVFATETSQNMKLDESAIKDMTGCDTVSSRALYGDYKSYTPAYKFLMEGNYKPIIQGTDHGIWRRIRLVKFGRTFTEEEIDRNLLSKLLVERDGILRWMLAGYKRWKQEGLGKPPESMQLEIDEYRSEMDILGQYIEEMLEQKEGGRTEIHKIYESYLTWLESNGYTGKLKKRKLTSELMRRGYIRDNSDIHHPFFNGIELLTANQ